VELFLNLAWLSVSLLLVTTWMRSERQSPRKFAWSTVIALLLLLVLLFPVISMTDDLVAINLASEIEHTMRRYEAPPSQTTSIALLDAIVLLAMVMIGIAFSGTCFTRVRPPAFAAKLLAGFVRASGVRPPPSAASLAA
jgi:glucan phosphoethanolaminetransferase (alkaline phosphatase superfamily)